MRHIIFVSLIGLILAAAFGCSATEARDSSHRAKRVAIVLTNHAELGDTGRETGFYLSEATHPYKVFTDAGYIVDFVSPDGGLAPMDGLDNEDTINDWFLSNPKLVKRTENTRAIASIDADDYHAVFFAGGHGTMWDFADDKGVPCC